MENGGKGVDSKRCLLPRNITDRRRCESGSREILQISTHGPRLLTSTAIGRIPTGLEQCCSRYRSIVLSRPLKIAPPIKQLTFENVISTFRGFYGSLRPSGRPRHRAPEPHDNTKTMSERTDSQLYRCTGCQMVYIATDKQRCTCGSAEVEENASTLTAACIHGPTRDVTW